MKETEILRGLGKARAKRYAQGLVPDANGTVHAPEPSIGGFIADRVHALTGTGEYAKPVAQPTLTPTTGNAAADALGGASAQAVSAIQQHNQTMRDAMNFSTGTTHVNGPGTGTSDSIHGVSLSKGEAVLPAKTVQAVGAGNIARLIEHTNNGIKPKGLGGARRFAVGEIPDAVSATSRVNPAPAPAAAPAPAPAPVASAAPADPVAPKPGIVQSAKNWGVRALGGTPDAAPAAPVSSGPFGLSGAKAMGARALALAPVAGAYQAATDTKENVHNLGDSLGMDTSSFGGRVGANIANFLDKTGNAATFGIAGKVGRGLAAAQGGGKFFDGWDSAEPAPAATPVAPQRAPTATTGQIAPAAPAPEAEQPLVQTTHLNTPQAQAMNRSIRSGQLSNGDMQPGTGLVTSSSGGGSFIDARGGLRAAQRAAAPQAADPDEAFTHSAERAQLVKDASDNSLGVGGRNRAAQRLEALDNNLTSLRSSIYSKQLGYSQLNRENMNDNAKRVNEILDRAATVNSGKNNAPQMDAAKRAGYDNLIASTYGKVGMDARHIQPAEMNEFLTLANTKVATDKSNDDVMGRLYNFVNQRHPRKSNDLTKYSAAGREDGVFGGRVRDQLGNDTLARDLHGTDVFGGSVDQDALDETEAGVNRTNRLRRN